jgi:hypothetical protein
MCKAARRALELMGQITGPLNLTGHPPTYRLPRYIHTVADENGITKVPGHMWTSVVCDVLISVCGVRIRFP